MSDNIPLYKQSIKRLLDYEETLKDQRATLSRGNSSNNSNHSLLMTKLISELEAASSSLQMRLEEEKRTVERLERDINTTIESIHREQETYTEMISKRTCQLLNHRKLHNAI